MSNRVEHPSYYQGKNGIEAIEVIRHYTCDISNAMKYLMRAGRKSEHGMSDIEKEFEDLRKARFYIDDFIFVGSRMRGEAPFVSKEKIADMVNESTGHSVDEIVGSCYEENASRAIEYLLEVGLVHNGMMYMCEDWMSSLKAARFFVSNRMMKIFTCDIV